MKSKWLALGMAALALAGLGAFAACGDGGSAGGEGGAGEGTAVSYSVSCEEGDVFGDYYNLDADYSKVGAGKKVTVTVSDAWNFISVSKVYANGTECAAGSEAGAFTFTMPEKDVTVTAEVTVNDVSEDDGMTWENPEETIMADSLINDSLRVSFGSKQVFNSTSTDGMMYAEVISTNQDVIPASSMRVESIESSGNGAYASGARILFDDGLTAGETTLIFIDTDNDRAITLDVTVVPRNY